ncbi:MAG: ABC-2 transporter permease [Lachnospiraceae bacterium]|nr:ABC-2 transporter permease [Lachnospiraceae bacterium]
MKGLLLKDYYVMKRNLIITCLACAYYLLILLIGSKHASTNEINIVFYVAFSVISCFLTSCAYLAIDHDKNSKTSLFIHSCPLTKGEIVFSKYLMTYLLLLSCMITFSLFAGLNHLMNGYTPDKNFYLVIFIILSVILIFTHIELPVAMRFGHEIAFGILIACICLLIIFGLMSIIKICLTDDFTNVLLKLSDKKTELLLLLTGLDFTSGIISFKVSKRI